jgi:hypothetical protein
MQRPRLKAFLLFLAFAVLANLLEPAISWLVLIKAHAIDATDRSWRPSLFIWFESCATFAALLATWIVARIGSRPMSSLGVGRPGIRQIAIGSLFGLVSVAILVGGIAALGGFSPGHIAMSGTPLFSYVVAFTSSALAASGSPQDSMLSSITPRFTSSARRTAAIAAGRRSTRDFSPARSMGRPGSPAVHSA